MNTTDGKEEGKKAGKSRAAERKGYKPMIPAADYLKWIQRFPLRAIEDEETNEVALELISELMDLSIEGKLKDGERAYYSALGVLIHEFEKKTYRSGPRPTGEEMLEFIMEQQNLRQADLVPLLGSQTTVSFILTGKRKLTRKQIEKLSAHFKVSPNVFLR